MTPKRPSYISYRISLEFSQTGAGMGHFAVVRGHLGAMTTQKDAPVIRDSRADERDQFRIHWNSSTFYLLFRSDKVFN